MARQAEQVGDYAAAERYYREALKQQSSAEIWNGLGVALNRQERFSDAAEAFSKASKIRPEVAGLRLNLGIALFRSNRLTEAADVFETLPGELQAQELLALSFVGLERYERAVPLLEKLASTSTDPALHLGLASCYERMGRKADVELAVARMFRVVPDGAPLHVALAEAYDRDSNLEGALAEYHKAATLDPTLRGAHLQTGRLLWKVRRFEEAEPEFEAELKANPGDIDSKYYLASIYLYRNDARRAIPLLNEFVRLRPAEKNGFFELGRALLKDNQIEKAIPALEKAASLGPNESNLHYQLAQAYRSAGRQKDAEREFRESNRLRTAQLNDYNQKFQSENSKNQMGRE